MEGSAAVAPPADGIGYELWRRGVDGAERTTVYAVIHPRAQTRVLTWPVLTTFGFLARPRVHIILKPLVTRRAAAVLLLVN